MTTPDGRIVKNGRIAELHLARKSHKCNECGGEIKPFQRYYSVIFAGSGLGGIKYPDRVHDYCVRAFLEVEQDGDISPNSNRSGNPQLGCYRLAFPDSVKEE